MHLDCANAINSSFCHRLIGDPATTATIVEDPRLRNLSGAFEDRYNAGKYLAQSLECFRGKDAIVLAIPSGGVPIGLAISSHLDLPFDLFIIRKIPVPGDPEAGFGAISLEGDMILNQPMVNMLRLSQQEIERLAEPVRKELEDRNRIFRENRPWPELAGRTAILTDDGLASGYTMIAAVRTAKRRNPLKIVVAVPTASLDTVRMLADEVDLIICPNIRTGRYFAVAEAYLDWYDLSKEEVVDMLSEHDWISKGN